MIMCVDQDCNVCTVRIMIFLCIYFLYIISSRIIFYVNFVYKPDHNDHTVHSDFFNLIKLMKINFDRYIHSNMIVYYVSLYNKIID